MNSTLINLTSELFSYKASEFESFLWERHFDTIQTIHEEAYKQMDATLLIHAQNKTDTGSFYNTNKNIINQQLERYDFERTS